MCICFLKSKAHKVTLKELLLFYYSEFHQVRAELREDSWEKEKSVGEHSSWPLRQIFEIVKVQFLFSGFPEESLTNLSPKN